MNQTPDKKIILIAWELYWLRFKKPGEMWYELTDHIRDSLVKEGHTVVYTDDDVIFDGMSMKGATKDEQPTQDTGHQNLINDIDALRAEVVGFEFHDFKNEKYFAPKIALADKFRELRNNTITGKYDNKND